MKRFMILWFMLSLLACHHSMDPWPSDTDRQDVTMYVRTRSLTGINTLPSVYQFFVYDKTQGGVRRYDINSESENPNLLHLKLFPGSYTGFCVTGAEEAESWEYAENSSPEEIYLKSQKTAKGNEEAGDHLLGTTDFEVTEEGGQVVFDLSRKVAMIKVIITNIPEWLTDLQINLSGVAQKMSLTGKYTGTYTISKSISLPEAGTSETSILFFPAETLPSISLSSAEMVFLTPEHEIESGLTNHITEIKVAFRDVSSSPIVDITTQLVEWDEKTIYEKDWEIDMPQGPCEGEGNGINLVVNGSFEETFSDDLPPNWKSDVSDKTYTATVTWIDSPVQSGQKAVMLGAKTYLYQDIPVIGGKCYQLNMHVCAPHAKVRWRAWGTWMKGSKDLPSDAIRTSYQNQTDGYIDVYEGHIFRAPTEATKLRMELRNYMDTDQSQGLYVDEIRVEAVD